MTTSLEGDVRQLIMDGENELRNARNPTKQKAILQPQYELYLRVLSRSQRPCAARAEDYLRVVAAMRDEAVLADLDTAAEADCSSLERTIRSPLRVADAYLKRLPGAVMLVIERGAGVLSFFALPSGREALADRIVLERASERCVGAFVTLLQQLDGDIERIERGEPVTKVFSDAIRQAARECWDALPETVRLAISGSDTVFFLPSAFGDLGAFPLELLCTKQGWLGHTHSIARFSSLRTLFETLSPNRMPTQRGEGALIVRAEDIDDLTGADAEIAKVRQLLVELGINVQVERSPRVKTVRSALDQGLAIIHYCGHGLAGRLGESLPLAEDESLGPHDFSDLSGYLTPFVYLSTCEVGRSRMATTGSAVGITTRLIEKGAPGVIGCLRSVPERVAIGLAQAFYTASVERSASEALTEARKQLGRKAPPSAWGVFAYFGDPNVGILSTHQAPIQTSSRTRRWDSMIGRHLAIRNAESRERAVDAIVTEQRDGSGDRELLGRVADWVKTSFRAERPESKGARLELIDAIAHEDSVAGCELRMLIAMEVLHGSYCGKRKADMVFSPEEVDVGLSCAKSIHDTLAWAAFAIEAGKTGGIAFGTQQLIRMLDEAAGALEGWLCEEPAAQNMIATVVQLKRNLVKHH